MNITFNVEKVINVNTYTQAIVQERPMIVRLDRRNLASYL